MALCCDVYFRGCSMWAAGWGSHHPVCHSAFFTILWPWEKAQHFAYYYISSSKRHWHSRWATELFELMKLYHHINPEDELFFLYYFSYLKDTLWLWSYKFLPPNGLIKYVASVIEERHWKIFSIRGTQLTNTCSSKFHFTLKQNISRFSDLAWWFLLRQDATL